ncbi:MAG: PC4/YdbC family ssDNA-binding protein [Candidatus Kariarchaeaceae archaeon]|jgi:hypothetical protein
MSRAKHSSSKKDWDKKVVAEKLLFQITKSENSSVKVREVTFDDGSVSVDIRNYIVTNKYDGPTKKGIMLPSDVFEQFKEELQKL